VNVSRLWPWAAFVAIGLISLALGLWLRSIYSPEWMSPDTTQTPTAMRPWAVEADCYSQLARVQRILNGQGLIQNHFAVENWPEGLVPSTTAPFDYAILLLYFPLRLVTQHPLDWAGALISPALWVALGLFWAFIRLREFNLAGRSLFLLGSAVMPQLIWATACGRPRHQSLIIALMAMGLTAEYERWRIELAPKRAWNIFAGIVWGLACWTSLFEPLLVAICLLVYNLIARRRENVAFLVSFGVVMLIALLLEGVHIFVPPPEYRDALLRWLTGIAEVQPYNVGLLWASDPGYGLLLGLMLAVLVLLTWSLRPWRLGGNTTDGLLVLLTFLLFVLALVQQRWGYYAALTELFVVVRFCQPKPLHWTRITVVGFLLLGIASSVSHELGLRDPAHPNQPSLELAQISANIVEPGGVLAPWWLSPGLLYFSGHPIVSGSSHCGISGIVASSKFFTTKSWAEAERILDQRKVRWIVVWDDPTYVYPLYNISSSILAGPLASDDDHRVADTSIAQLLITNQYLPTAMHLRAVTGQMKLYEYVPEVR
jgi:hypothetical protein